MIIKEQRESPPNRDRLTRPSTESGLCNKYTQLLPDDHLSMSTNIGLLEVPEPHLFHLQLPLGVLGIKTIQMLGTAQEGKRPNQQGVRRGHP